MKSNLYLIIFGIIFLGKLSAQTKSDNLREDISNLTNQSVILSFNYLIEYELDSKANEILKSENTEKKTCLIENLKDKNKALVAHVLLTKLIEPENASLNYKYIYNADNTEIISIDFSLNGLTWIYNETKKDLKLLSIALHQHIISIVSLV